MYELKLKTKKSRIEREYIITSNEIKTVFDLRGEINSIDVNFGENPNEWIISTTEENKNE